MIAKGKPNMAKCGLKRRTQSACDKVRCASSALWKELKSDRGRAAVAAVSAVLRQIPPPAHPVAAAVVTLATVGGDVWANLPE